MTRTGRAYYTPNLRTPRAEVPANLTELTETPRPRFRRARQRRSYVRWALCLARRPHDLQKIRGF